ncbi:MAG: hypothetical protein GY860_00155, partial [Desulfobacteraceae bacterium]|nr:hypothetical protein [Desulfobacteraceae bacterium]
MAQNPWAFRTATGMEHQEERIMFIILGLLFLVLASLLLFGNNTPLAVNLIKAMILISFIVIKKTLDYRSRLIEKAEKESKEKFEKTRQLEFVNKKLLASYHETRKADENYRILVETAMDAIFITQEGIIKFLNQRTVDMLGYSKGALLEKSFHGLV